MNPFAVLQNTETHEKIGFGSPHIYPKVSFLDPTYTLSVPLNYTAYGIADLVAHCLEAWFGEGDSPLSDRFVAAIIREAVEAGPLLLAKPDSYELRERIMWAATCALNGMTLHGRKSGDWGVHDIGHTLSFLYDIPHGASLSIAYPAWLRFHNRKLGKRIQLLGQEVFGTNGTKTTIEALEDFFLKIDCPVRLGDVKIPKRDREKIIELLRKNNVSGMYHKLNRSSLDKITDLMYSV
jgi:alcohol dehydrogenase YqhD (iron-dependent ADH family)